MVSRHVGAACVVLGLVGSVGERARADQQPACSVGERSALSEIGCELGRALPKLPRGTLVVSAPLISDAAPQAPDALTARLSHVVAGALGARAVEASATLATARTLASSAGTLLYLSAEVAQGELRITADLYPVPKSFWDRVRDPRPSPSAHAFVSRRLDPELRTFFPPVPLVAKQIQKAISSEANPVAIACGDVDGDGALELVLVGRHRISLGRVRGGRFVAAVTRQWTEVSPLSRAPLRQPIASAWVHTGQFVDVGLSDRLETIRFDAGLRPLHKLGRRLPWPGGGCAHLVGLSLKPVIEPCLATDPKPLIDRVEQPADAIAGAKLVGADGRARLIRASRVFGESVVLLRDDAGRTARAQALGAQLAMGDLDGNGEPELVSGADVLDPSGDALIVHTWQGDGKVVERLRLAVPSGVRAVADCPADSSGLSAVAIATQRAIWIVR